MGKPLEAAAGPAAPSGAPTASPRYFAPADHIAPSPEASRLAGAPAAASVAPALSPALGRARTRQHAAGVAGFGLLLFAAGAAPGALPAVFLAFVLTALPWRCADFVKRRWTFFLIDFCYFVNLAAALFLLFAPDSPEAEALVYALSDGPLAGALVAWQCAWVFGDSEHTVRCACARPHGGAPRSVRAGLWRPWRARPHATTPNKPPCHHAAVPPLNHSTAAF